MNHPEGVIKYRLDFTTAPAHDFAHFNSINQWRDKLWQLGLIGRDPVRYQGDAYGNISCRQKPGNKAFYISATQTGELPSLSEQHYSLVTECDIKQNHIVASGPARPSSEALTHCAVYQAAPDIDFVFHVHCPEIWQHADKLDIMQTGADIAYGTVAMAEEIRSLVETAVKENKRILCMKGHEDGIITYGKTAEEAGNTILNYLGLARMRTSLPG